MLAVTSARRAFVPAITYPRRRDYTCHGASPLCPSQGRNIPMAADITVVPPTAAQQDAAVPAGSRHLGLALVVISMAQLMLVLDELIVNTALPHIQQALPSRAAGRDRR